MSAIPIAEYCMFLIFTFVPSSVVTQSVISESSFGMIPLKVSFRFKLLGSLNLVYYVCNMHCDAIEIIKVR